MRAKANMKIFKSYKIGLYVFVVVLAWIDALTSLVVISHFGVDLEQNLLVHQLWPHIGLLSFLVVAFRNMFIYAAYFLLADRTHRVLYFLADEKEKNRCFNISEITVWIVFTIFVLLMYAYVFANNLHVFFNLIN